MLKSLQVKDYALIEEINVEFGKGLNIITGETGAGKSILIDAMGLLLGERASTDVVRKNASKSVVEGIFDIESNKKVKKILEENDIDFFPELIVRREISLKGSNRCFLNDTPVPLTLVKEIGNLLVDLHGQHEHQSLLRTETHIEFLDEFGDLEKELSGYRKNYKQLTDLLNELTGLKEKEESLKEKKEIYEFQIKEIDAVSPEEDEEEKLEEELNILENSEKLMQLTSEIYEGLYQSDNSVYDSLTRIKNELEELAEIDRVFQETGNECNTAVELIKDISGFIRSYNSRINLEPAQLEQIRERLGALNLLKKRYGGSLKAVIEHRKKIGEEFNLAENYSEKISSLEKEIKNSRKICGISAEKLSQKRKEAALKIQKEVKEVLAALGISNSIFEVRINQETAGKSDDNFVTVKDKFVKADQNGIDKVEFFISMNPGEDSKPLSKVASGGEISRIMLSLKSILAKNDKLPLLIFDEIDTGVSGRIAKKVGDVLKSLSEFHQIIAITHLPQIAGQGKHHYSVEKQINEKRVTSVIKKLNDEERIKEVAKLMSGENITEAGLKGAKELINQN